MNEGFTYFAISFLIALTFANFARFVLRGVVTPQSASVGGLALAFGYAIGEASGLHELSVLIRVAALSGTLVGLVAAWFQFFKWTKANG